MKTSIKTIILAAASIFAAMSCQKEAAVPETQSPENAGETIQVNINASLCDIVSADNAKATAKSVVRLEWTDGDKVQAYCGTTKISTGDGLTVTPSQNGLLASLTGTIEAPTPGKTITFVYSSGCDATGLTFDFSSQDTNIPFVAYGTLVYDGKAITNKMIEFKFATSIMKIAATNLAGGTISNASIKGINTKVTLTPAADSETCGIVGDAKATITKTSGIEASSDGTRAIITIGLVPDNNKERNIAVSQTGYINKGAITSAKIISNTSYTTPVSLFPCGTQDGHDYVLIAGTKWATQNLAITSSGQSQWLSNVYLPGTTTPVQNGDYFQWGAYVGYCGKATDNDKGLLVYTSFANTSIKGKDKCSFKQDCSPYFSSTSSSYTKYNDTDKNVTLVPIDDVASILWQGTWRMPTPTEFQALYAATYWKFDETDKGIYVYAPQSGDAGKTTGDSGVTGSYNDKASALLFFPATGHASGQAIVNMDGHVILGNYWLSTLYSSNQNYANRLYFGDIFVASTFTERYCGLTVRPVSD